MVPQSGRPVQLQRQRLVGVDERSPILVLARAGPPRCGWRLRPAVSASRASRPARAVWHSRSTSRGRPSQGARKSAASRWLSATQAFQLARVCAGFSLSSSSRSSRLTIGPLGLPREVSSVRPPPYSTRLTSSEKSCLARLMLMRASFMGHSCRGRNRPVRIIVQQGRVVGSSRPRQRFPAGSPTQRGVSRPICSWDRNWRPAPMAPCRRKAEPGGAGGRDHEGD
jgi:hypothetical protein